jgi:ataxin-10
MASQSRAKKFYPPLLPAFMSHLLSLFKSACSSFDINTLDSHQPLCECLDALAGDLGKDVQARIQLGAGDVWSDIHRLWRDLVHAQLTFWDGDDDDDDDDGGGEEDTASIKQQKKQLSLRALCLSLARFIRNLVAGVAANQTKAFEDELIIRRLLHYYSSWSSWQDKQGKENTQSCSPIVIH